MSEQLVGCEHVEDGMSLDIKPHALFFPIILIAYCYKCHRTICWRLVSTPDGPWYPVPVNMPEQELGKHINENYSAELANEPCVNKRGRGG